MPLVLAKSEKEKETIFYLVVTAKVIGVALVQDFSEQNTKMRYQLVEKVMLALV